MKECWGSISHNTLELTPIMKGSNSLTSTAVCSCALTLNITGKKHHFYTLTEMPILPMTPILNRNYTGLNILAAQGCHFLCFLPDLENLLRVILLSSPRPFCRIAIAASSFNILEVINSFTNFLLCDISSLDGFCSTPLDIKSISFKKSSDFLFHSSWRQGLEIFVIWRCSQSFLSYILAFL